MVEEEKERRMGRKRRRRKVDSVRIAQVASFQSEVSSVEINRRATPEASSRRHIDP